MDAYGRLRKLKWWNLDMNLCNCLILICSIQHQKKVALWPKISKRLKIFGQFDRLLKKISVKAALNAEMTPHLSYDKNQTRSGANSRNGDLAKTVFHFNCREWRQAATSHRYCSSA